MSSFNNILIIFVFTILLIIKLIKSDCIKLGETFPCDNTQNIPCCPGLYCRIITVKNQNVYRCSKDKCNTDGMGCKSDNACCYGTKCKGGKCTKCAKVYESCDIGECCEGSCSITDNFCY